MKKLILSLIGLFLFTGLAVAQTELSHRITLDEVINRRNVLITHPETDEKYLLHLKNGCGDLKTGQNVSLIIHGTLNYNRDFIKIDAWRKCEIDQAEVITGKLYVALTRHADEAYVTDENNKKYFITYSPFCRSIARYWKDYIYVRSANTDLAKGDRVFLPNRDGLCTLRGVEEVSVQLPDAPIEETDDTRVPTTVVRVKAGPGNGKVFLSWKAASDDVEISHYIVSYSKSRIYTRDLPVSAMPNQVEVEGTNHTIEGLENNQQYYFYVLAVDTSGNESSRWSIGAKGTPRASLSVGSSELSDFDLHVLNESSRSIMIQWNYLPGTSRQTVILEVDGKREYARTSYSKRNIRVLKRPHREGKVLTLKVRAYGFRGLIKEDEINFSY